MAKFDGKAILQDWIQGSWVRLSKPAVEPPPLLTRTGPEKSVKPYSNVSNIKISEKPTSLFPSRSSGHPEHGPHPESMMRRSLKFTIPSPLKWPCTVDPIDNSRERPRIFSVWPGISSSRVWKINPVVNSPDCEASTRRRIWPCLLYTSDAADDL